MALKLKISKIFTRSTNSSTDSDVTQPTSSTIDGLPERNAMLSPVVDEAGGLDCGNHAIQVPTSYESNFKKDDDTLSIDSTTPLLQDQPCN